MPPGRPKKDPNKQGVVYESNASSPVLILAGPKMKPYILQTFGDRVEIMEPAPHRVYLTRRAGTTLQNTDDVYIVGE